MIFRRILLGIFLTFPLGCVAGDTVTRPMLARSLTTDVSKQFEPLRVNSIVVYPVVVDEGARQSGGDSAALTADLLKAFELKTSIELLNLSQSKRVSAELGRVNGKPTSLSDRAVSLAKNVSAQGALIGQVTRYEESDGSRFGAENGAAFSFSLQLLDPQSGKSLWSARFDRQEQPLTDNLFKAGESLHGGLEYRTRAQLVAYGFETAAAELERSRHP